LIVPTARLQRLITGREAPRAEVENLRKLGALVDLV